MLVHNPKEELFMIQDDAVEHYAKEHPEKLKEAEEKGYETLLEGSKKVWEKIWKS